MIIAVPKEIQPEENRVALSPEGAAKLVKLGLQLRVEKGAGLLSSYADEQYVQAGAAIESDAGQLYKNADILLKVQRPMQHPSGKHELEMMKSGAVYVGFFFPLNNPALAKQAADLGINVIAMDAIPRITKAQRMDALSSQTNLAGYKAVLFAATKLSKIFPLMMTAAGTIQPAKVVIMGAGVAGLQAVATARRLGAVVWVSDVRAAVKEQVESLGAKYIDLPVQENLEGQGGYAKEASEDFLKKQREILTKHISESDVVITTALIPGKRAPILVTKDMVAAMRPGSVIVDMAAEQGGNCELTEPGKTCTHHGVAIIGETNLISTVATHASELYSRNIVNLLEYLWKESTLKLDPSDEIVKGSLITRDGQVVHEATKKAVESASAS